MKKNYTPHSASSLNTSPISVWLWVALAFLAGYVIAIWFDWGSVKSTYQALWVSPPAHPKKASLPAVAVKPQFEFYTLLTQNEPETATAQQAAKTVTEQKIALTPAALKTEQFMVQLAAFNNPVEAEKMRAALALKGVNTRVIASEEGTHPWYRVIAGPFSNREEAVAAQNNMIKKEGIRGMIRKT